MDLKEFLEKNKISSSIICGQKDNGSFTDLMYVSSKKSKSGQDLWILSHNNYFKDVEIKSVKDLKNAYKYIHISDQDELWINNKKIPKKDIPNTI